MQFLKAYNENIVQYDLINKFRYNTVKELEKNKKSPRIFVQIDTKKLAYKKAISSLLALQLITFTNYSLVCNKMPKRKNGITSYGQVILTKKNLYLFLTKFIWLWNPQLHAKKKSCMFNIPEPLLIFKELEHYFQLVIGLKKIRIVLLLQKNTQNFNFVLESLKIK